jgi:hypothetical protein
MLPKLPGKSELAAAIRYARNHWIPLRRYLDDGRLEIDTDVFDKLFFQLRCYCLPARVTARRRAGSGMKILPRSLSMVAPLLWRPCASRAAEVSMLRRSGGTPLRPFRATAVLYRGRF